MKTEVLKCWGIRVDGPRPYIGYDISPHKWKVEKECLESYQRPVKVVIVPLAEWRRLNAKKR